MQGGETSSSADELEEGELREPAGYRAALTSEAASPPSIFVPQAPALEQTPAIVRLPEGVSPQPDLEVAIVAKLNEMIHHKQWVLNRCLQYLFEQAQALSMIDTTSNRLSLAIRNGQWSSPPLPVPVQQGSMSAQSPFGLAPRAMAMPKLSQAAKTWTREQIANGEVPDEFPEPRADLVIRRQDRVLWGPNKIGMMRRIVVPGYMCKLPHASKDPREAQHPPETHNLWEVLLRVRDRDPLNDRGILPRCPKHQHPAEGDDHTPDNHGVLQWCWHTDNPPFASLPLSWQSALMNVFTPISELEEGLAFHPYIADPVNEVRPDSQPAIRARIEYNSLLYAYGVDNASYADQFALLRQGKPGLRLPAPSHPSVLKKQRGEKPSLKRVATTPLEQVDHRQRSSRRLNPQSKD